jgi:16S rRNA G966 N2-methylase RsmD
MNEVSAYQIFEGNCLELLQGGRLGRNVDLTFLDPPFNQNKDYAFHDDNLTDED